MLPSQRRPRTAGAGGSRPAPPRPDDQPPPGATGPAQGLARAQVWFLARLAREVVEALRRGRPDGPRLDDGPPR
jgi:hypothetical protein